MTIDEGGNAHRRGMNGDKARYERGRANERRSERDRDDGAE